MTNQLIESLSSLFWVNIVITQKFGKSLERSTLLLFYFPSNLMRKCESAFHTSVSLTWCILSTPRALDWSPVFGLLGFYISPKKSSVLSFITFLTKSGKVAAGVIAPPFSSLSILNSRLRHSEIDKPPSIRLSKVGWGNVLRDASTVSSVFEIFIPGIVRRPFRTSKLGPEEVVIASWMFIQPSLQVRNGVNEMDWPLTTFSIDVYSDTVLGIKDIAYTEIVEFPTSASCLKLDSKQCLIAWISSCFNHRQNVIFPKQQISLTRNGIKVVTRGRRNPSKRIWRIIEFQTVSPECPQGCSIVLICMFVRVLSMYPSDNSLGWSSELKR